MNSQFTRRTFLKSTIAASAALSLPARVRAQAAGSNDDIRVAVIGFNSRGGDHIANYTKLKGVRLVALCDVDTKVLDRGKAQMAKKDVDVATYPGHPQAAREQGNRRRLDRHAESLAFAGCDLGLSGGQGCLRRKARLAQRLGRAAAGESRGRSSTHRADGRAEPQRCRPRERARVAENFAARQDQVRPRPLLQTPAEHRQSQRAHADSGDVDYDLWCGPAEKLPLMRKKLHYDWHWVWNTGNGDLGNQGIHQMDIARRFLGENALSPAVFSVGGRLGYVDDGETPNSLIVFHDYKAAPLIFEVRGLPSKTGAKEMDKYRGASVGVIVQYENGYVVCPDYNNAAVYDNKDELLRVFGNPKVPKDVVRAESFEQVVATPGRWTRIITRIS